MSKLHALARAVSTLTAGRVKYGWWTANYKSTAAPIILGGASRSGTTLVREILNAHKNLYIGPETGVFVGNRDCGHISRVTSLGIGQIERMYQASACMGEFVERLLSTIMVGQAKNVWGEKTPANIRSIPLILSFFPKARIVHIVRDGRDVVCSLRTHPEYQWRNGREERTGILNDWETCCNEWVADVWAGIEWRDDPRYYEVQYEDLVRQPEGAMRKLIEWLGVDWDGAALTSYMTSRSPNHPKLAQPISASSVGRWRRDLPQDARVTLARVGGAALRELGYVDGDWWVDEAC